MSAFETPEYKLRLKKTESGHYLLIRVFPGDRSEMYSRERGWRPNRGELLEKATALYLYNSFKG